MQVTISKAEDGAIAVTATFAENELDEVRRVQETALAAFSEITRKHPSISYMHIL